MLFMSFTLLYFKKPFCRLGTTDWSKLFLVAIIYLFGFFNALNAQNLNKSVDLTTADPQPPIQEKFLNIRLILLAQVR